jgi:hypothetical protein
MENFLALLDLYRHYQAALPVEWLVDFALIYGIASEALPLMEDELLPGPAAEGIDIYKNPLRRLLADLALYRRFIEGRKPLGNPAGAPYVRLLLKPQTAEYAGEEFITSLSKLDEQLRRDWNSSFFEFFYPPVLREASFKGFETCPAAGESSYTAYWVSFSSHKPLTATLAALARNPEGTLLSFGVDRPRKPLSLEQELIEELRRESGEVRELLKGPEPAGPQESGGGASKKGPLKFPGAEAVKKLPPPPSYLIPRGEEILRFLAELGEGERSVLKLLLDSENRGADSPRPAALLIDRINAGFEERFHDLLVLEDSGGNPSIPEEYRSILQESWV